MSLTAEPHIGMDKWLINVVGGDTYHSDLFSQRRIQ